MRLDLDEGAGRRRGATLDRQPHAPRLVADPRAFDPIDAQNKTIGLLAFLAQLDKTRERNAVGGITQDRVIDQRALEGCGRKARGDAEKAKREHEAERAAAQQHRGDDCNDRQT